VINRIVVLAASTRALESPWRIVDLVALVVVKRRGWRLAALVGLGDRVPSHAVAVGV
jgi:hypothetical protein